METARLTEQLESIEDRLMHLSLDIQRLERLLKAIQFMLEPKPNNADKHWLDGMDQ